MFKLGVQISGSFLFNVGGEGREARRPTHEESEIGCCKQSQIEDLLWQPEGERLQPLGRLPEEKQALAGRVLRDCWVKSGVESPRPVGGEHGVSQPG